MTFLTSDTDLSTMANLLIRPDEYLRFRDKYQVHNPKRRINITTHRCLIGASVATAKKVIDNGGTDEEVKRACLYMKLCFDGRKYMLDCYRAKRDLKIEELESKYVH